MKKIFPLIIVCGLLALTAFQNKKQDSTTAAEPQPPVKYTDTIPMDFKVVFGMGGPYGKWEGRSIYYDGQVIKWQGRGIETNETMGPVISEEGMKHLWNLLHNHDYFSMENRSDDIGLLNLIIIDAAGVHKTFKWQPALRDSVVTKLEFLFVELHELAEKAKEE